MGTKYQGFALPASQLRHVIPSPRPPRSPPSATNLRPAKGRRLGHSPQLGPVRDVAPSIPRTAGGAGAMKPGCALLQCHLEPPVALFVYEKYYTRRGKQAPVLRRRSCSESRLSRREVSVLTPWEAVQWCGPLGNPTGSLFEPDSFSGAQGRVPAQLLGRLSAASRPGWGR